MCDRRAIAQGLPVYQGRTSPVLRMGFSLSNTTVSASVFSQRLSDPFHQHVPNPRDKAQLYALTHCLGGAKLLPQITGRSAGAARFRSGRPVGTACRIRGTVR